MVGGAGARRRCRTAWARVHQPAGNQVDDHTTDLEERVADERLVAVRSRRHLDEGRLTGEPSEPVDPDPDRPAYLGCDDPLIARFEVHHGQGLELAQVFLPGKRKDEAGRPRVDDSVEALLARRVAPVRNGNLHHNLAHPWLPPRDEWPDTVHTRTPLAILRTIISHSAFRFC